MAGLERVHQLPDHSRVDIPNARTELIELAPIGVPTHGKNADLGMAPSSYVPTLHRTSSGDHSGAVSIDPDAISPAQRAKHRLNSRIYFAVLCYTSFLEGWNDGSLGPLLPRI